MQSLLITGTALAVFATASFAQDMTYDVGAFDSVDASAGVEVEVTVGPDFSVVADAKRGDIEDLDISVSGDTLMITRESTRSWGLFGMFKRDDYFVVTVTMPELVELSSTSGADVTVFGPSDTLERLSGTSGSTLVVQDAALDAIVVEATSGATVRIQGSCADLTAESTSGATLSAGDLACATADLEASSGASMTANATETAKVQASSGASLNLSGGAETLEQDVSSGASLSAD